MKRGDRGYPMATVAFYGPDASRASKVAVGIVPSGHQWRYRTSQVVIGHGRSSEVSLGAAKAGSSCSSKNMISEKSVTRTAHHRSSLQGRHLHPGPPRAKSVPIAHTGRPAMAGLARNCRSSKVVVESVERIGYGLATAHHRRSECLPRAGLRRFDADSGLT